MCFEPGAQIFLLYVSPIAMIHESGYQGMVAVLTFLIIRSTNVPTELLLPAPTILGSVNSQILLSVIALVTQKVETEKKSYL